MSVFRVPDLGEGLHEVQIVAWHVNVGDHVVVDQPLVSVETDKAVVEIPAPQSGRIVARFGEPNDVVPIGSPLVELAGETATADAGTVVGALPEQALPGGVHAAPAVRHLAAELGVDLGDVAGTGPSRSITRADVEREAGASGAPAENAEPLRGVRRAMATNMVRSHAEVVPATVHDDADVGDWAPDTDVTLRVVRAIVAGCAEAPSCNAWYLGPNRGRVLHEHVDLGIAVDTDDGLFVPVLRDVTHRDPADLRRGLGALRADVRARTIPPEELRGQTITLSNFGSIGGRYAELVIVPPQVAILGAGSLRERVVARHGAPVVRRVLPLSLTFDHRVVTGGEAARFLAAVRRDLQQTT